VLWLRNILPAWSPHSPFDAVRQAGKLWSWEYYVCCLLVRLDERIEYRPTDYVQCAQGCSAPESKKYLAPPSINVAEFGSKKIDAKAEHLLLLLLIFFHSNKTRLVLKTHSTKVATVGRSNNAGDWGKCPIRRRLTGVTSFFKIRIFRHIFILISA